jgi:DNA-binding MarR family transcriptional regulator
MPNIKESPATESSQIISNHLGYHLRRAYSRFNKLFQEYSKAFGLKSQQVTILTSIRDNPGINPAQIADAHAMERSLLTMLVGDLKSREFVVKRFHEGDKRKKGLYLTSQGESFIHEIMIKLYDDFEPKHNQNLSPAEQKALSSLLIKLYSD